MYFPFQKFKHLVPKDKKYTDFLLAIFQCRSLAWKMKHFFVLRLQKAHVLNLFQDFIGILDKIHIISLYWLNHKINKEIVSSK